MGIIKNTDLLHGKYVNLREVNLSDAAFILSLRCDDRKAKFIHKTEYDLEKQIEYLKKYKNKEDEWYFIIEDKTGKPIGTIRIYDLRSNSFCYGSWLMADGVSSYEVFESDYLTRMFGFQTLEKNMIHFDVRKGNKKLLQYHKIMGAIIVGEKDMDYFFECSKDAFLEKSKLFI